MKKVFAVFAVLAAFAVGLVLAGCPTEDTTEKNTQATTMKIKNESSGIITGVVWQNVEFADGSEIKSGRSQTENITPGSGYIYFKRINNPIYARTQELAAVEKDQNAEFVFTDNTVIVEVNNQDNTGLMGTLQATKDTTFLSWSGDWKKTGDSKYTSNPVNVGSSTWETLTISTNIECRVAAMLSASCSNSYTNRYPIGSNGYASKLDMGSSTDNFQFYVSGTESGTATYKVPVGTHYLYFGYTQGSGMSGDDNVTVEVSLK